MPMSWYIYISCCQMIQDCNTCKFHSSGCDGQFRVASRRYRDTCQRSSTSLRVHDCIHRGCQAGQFRVCLSLTTTMHARNFGVFAEVYRSFFKGAGKGAFFFKSEMQFVLQVGRLENAIGWYHSHPGYGCWLSGIDVSTQMLNQNFQVYRLDH